MSQHSAASKRVTVPQLAKMKAEGTKIAMLTAYDYSMARLVDRAGADIVLVGDSLGMVVQGRENTIPVTVEQMIYHAEMVVRATQYARVLGVTASFGDGATRCTGVRERRREDLDRLRDSVGIKMLCSQGLSPQGLSRGVEPIPSLNGSPLGQDKFLLPPRTNSVTSMLAGYRLPTDRLPVDSRHRQSVYGCLEQLVPGTSRAPVRLTRYRETYRQPPLGTHGTRPHQGKPRSTESEREIVECLPTSDSTKGTQRTERVATLRGLLPALALVRPLRLVVDRR